MKNTLFGVPLISLLFIATANAQTGSLDISFNRGVGPNTNVFGTNYRALQPFEDFNTVSHRWSKSSNWLLFREMIPKDFEGTELGKFIQEKLIPYAT